MQGPRRAVVRVGLGGGLLLPRWWRQVAGGCTEGYPLFPLAVNM